MARRATLRASDEDRERIAERLRQAAAEGRLLAHELEERLATALRASTYGELDPLVADLPGSRLERRRSTSVRHWLAPAVGLAIAIPLALALIAAIVFLVTGVLAMWGVWLFVGWWVFGHRRRYPGARSTSGPGRRAGTCGARRAQPRPGFWL